MVKGLENTEPDITELQAGICIQHKAMQLMSGWYMKAASEIDPSEDHQGSVYYGIRDKLVAAALREARATIEAEKASIPVDEKKNAATGHR